jgi:hypothetical protein
MVQSWYDINKDGKRLNAVIKMMWTKAQLEQDPSLQLAYIDRVIKATNSKVNIAETVLGIKQILAEAKKSLPQPQIVPAEVVTLNSGK